MKECVQDYHILKNRWLLGFIWLCCEPKANCAGLVTKLVPVANDKLSSIFRYTANTLGLEVPPPRTAWLTPISLCDRRSYLRP